MDDFFWGGTLAFKEQVIDRVKKRFEISHEDSSSFKYLGSQYKQYPVKILAYQQNYIDNKEFIPVKRKDKNSKLNRKERRLLRGAAGQLNWVASQTQPDIAFDACASCVSLKNAVICDILLVNKSIRKLKAVNIVLHFNDIGNIGEASTLCYCDSSFCNLKGENSQGVYMYIVFLQGSNGKVSPVTWQSKRIKRIVKSTLAEEALALDESADACFYVRTILCEISGKNEENIFPIIVNKDNKNLYDAVHWRIMIQVRHLQFTSKVG